MNRGKFKKRKYFSSNLMAKKRKDLFLKPGLKGFISTCNGNEKQCIRESYNLLNEYADILYGEEKKNVETPKNQDDDVMDEFQKEIEELQTTSRSERRFQAVDTGILNCLFIQTNIEDPVELMKNIVEDLSEKKVRKTRHLLRMVPVELTCKAYLDDLKNSVGPVLDKYFSKEACTYSIVFNRRHNSNLDRDEVIEMLATLVKEKNPEHQVNLSNPTYAIMVEVMKNLCSISVIRDYVKFSKYNLSLICGFDPNEKEEKIPESGEICQEQTEAKEKASEAGGSGDAKDESKLGD